MPELLGRGEIGLTPAEEKTNELIAKHKHTRGFVLICIVLYFVSLGELEKAVETLTYGSCSHRISRSPKLSVMFL